MVNNFLDEDFSQQEGFVEMEGQNQVLFISTDPTFFRKNSKMLKATKILI